MVDKNEFFRVADEIRAEGQQPSQRNIRERLAKGGSFSELGKLYIDWATARDYLPRPTREDLPERLRDKLATFAAEIWSDGRRSASEALMEKARAAIAERDAARLALAVASARVDELEETMGLRPAKAAVVQEAPIEAAAPAEAEGARDFWNRVMLEIHELLRDRTLGADAILAEMDVETVAEAARRLSNWGPGRLIQKLRERVKRKRFFLEPKDGVFCRIDMAA